MTRFCHAWTIPSRHSTAAVDLVQVDAPLRQRLLEAGRARARASKGATKAAEAHSRAECALRDHPSLGRYLRQLRAGRLVIDRAKVAAEERLDGKYLLSSSDPDLSAEDIALGYLNLLEAERAFGTSSTRWSCGRCSTASSTSSAPM